MSWIITRHLYKSGGNNIAWRIGQYNKRSSLGYITCNQISTYFKHSKKNKNFQEQMKMSRNDNIMHNLYSGIDADIHETMANVYIGEIMRTKTVRRLLGKYHGSYVPMTDIYYDVAHFIHTNKRYRSMNSQLIYSNNTPLLERIMVIWSRQ